MQEVTGLSIVYGELKALSDRLSDRIDKLEYFWQEVSFCHTQSFSQYKGIHSGQELAIVATGPSLLKYKPQKDVIHIGVNKAYKYPLVKLDYYFAQDFSNSDAPWIRDLREIQCPIFLGKSADLVSLKVASENLRAELDAHTYFVSTSPADKFFPDIRFHPLFDSFSVVFPALHFALFTNPKRIYLVGCDTTYDGYFDGTTQLESACQKQKILIDVITGFRRIKEYSAQWYPETEIVSINPVNLRGLFSDVFTDGADVSFVQAAAGDLHDFSDAGIVRMIEAHIEQVSGFRAEQSKSFDAGQNKAQTAVKQEQDVKIIREKSDGSWLDLEPQDARLLAKAYLEVLDSTSWKITKPLRVLGGLFKRKRT
jgi:hypothetical protein